MNSLISNFLKSKVGKVVLSILWALGIAALFAKVCNGTDCLVVKDYPDALGDGCGGIIKHDLPSNNCYTLEQYQVPCKTNPNAPPPPYNAVRNVNPDEYYRPPQCMNRDNFKHPGLLYLASRKAMNCGDPRHQQGSVCYPFSPMDTIFRAESEQVLYPYTRA